MKKSCSESDQLGAFRPAAFAILFYPGATMGLPGKIKTMLHQISWHAYIISTVLFLAVYYSFVVLAYYRADLHFFFLRLTGKQPALKAGSEGLIPAPEYDIMGAARPDSGTYAGENELEFAPAEIPDDESDPLTATELLPPAGSKPALEFSDMAGEIKTLIRVINESGESQENFGMLFKLIIQKYPDLAGTDYRARINEYVLTESEGQFPFSLSLPELESYWSN